MKSRTYLSRARRLWRSTQRITLFCPSMPHSFVPKLSLATSCLERQVGLRGISLALLALTLQGWAVLVMLGVWGVRVTIARASEASDLKMSKVCYRGEIHESTPDKA